MKKKALICSLCFSFCFFFLGTSCLAQCKPECVITVKNLLKEQKYGISTTWLDKSNRELGDGVAIALSKIYSKKRLLRLANIKLYLPLIREAFQDVKMIIENDNRAPIATLRLLENVKKKHWKNSRLVNDVSTLINEIVQKTSAGS